MIKFKNRKKENLKFQKIGTDFKKSWEVFDELLQNYSKTNFGTVFKKNFTKLGKIFTKFWKIVDDIL